MGEVINMFAFRNTKNVMLSRVEAYKDIVDEMDKLELLEEMVRFQETKAKDSTYLHREENVLRGLALFKNLILTSETNELREFATTYHTFLEKELQNLTNPETA